MGTILRQSLITSIVSYIGVVLGYINLLYLYPKFLDLGEIGLLRTIQDAGILLSPLAQIGLSQTIIRYYPKYSNENGSDFINLIMVLSIGGFSIISVILFFSKPMILSLFGDNAIVLEQYVTFIWWLTFILMMTALLESVSRSCLKVVFPNLVKEVFVRLMQGILVYIYFSDIINFHQFIFWSVGLYFIALLILFAYLIREGVYRVSFRVLTLSRKDIVALLLYSLASLLGTGAITLILKLDSLMVTMLSTDGFRANAIYTTAFYMATVIEIPKRAIAQSNTTLISRAFQINALDEVSRIYRQTSINQLIIGSLIFLGIFINLDNLYDFIPKGDIYKEGSLVVVLIGCAKLIDMGFGPNSEILIMSRHYPLHILTLVIMGVTVVVLNYILIPTYGIVGAGVGTFAAYFIYNLSKYIFIYWNYRLQPFQVETIKVMAIVVGLVLINYLLPNFDNTLIDLAIRSSVTTILFTALIVTLKCSPQINNFLRKVLSKLT